MAVLYSILHTLYIQFVAGRRCKYYVRKTHTKLSSYAEAKGQSLYRVGFCLEGLLCESLARGQQGFLCKLCQAERPAQHEENRGLLDSFRLRGERQGKGVFSQRDAWQVPLIGGL